MRVIVIGAKGRMGAEVCGLLRDASDMILVAAVDSRYPASCGDCYLKLSDFSGAADMLLDFSHHDGTEGLLDYAVARGLPTVIAATGHNAEQTKLIHRAAEKIPLFFSANLSLGVAFLTETVRRAAVLFPDADIEITEIHHKDKLDAPSGTAKQLLSVLGTVREGTAVCGRYGHRRRDKREIGIHSLRIGGAAGEHSVMLSTGEETLILTHRAENAALFAKGALTAMRFLIYKRAGLYDMGSLLREQEGE